MDTLLTLTPILAAVGAIIALWVSRPAHHGWASIATTVILAAAVWSSIAAWHDWSDRQAQQKDREALRKVVYSELETITLQVVMVIRAIIMHASDGWILSDEAAFFSAQTARLMCRHLNIEAQAPVLPKQTRLTWIAHETKNAQDRYLAVFRANASVLDDELIQALTSMQASFLLTWPYQWDSSRRLYRTMGSQIHGPPVLCNGVEALEHAMEHGFAQFYTLYRLVRSRTNSKPLPMPTRVYGKSRFSPEDLARWERAHPSGSPGAPSASSAR